MLSILGIGFVRELERHGALGIYVPLEGGYEGRFQRRARAAGYGSLSLSARGLGDLAAYLTGVHGVRPPHLGKRNIGRDDAAGDVYYLPPIIETQLAALPPQAKGLVLWIIEGHILSRQEIGYLVKLTQDNDKIKVVLEVGGDRYVHWQPLTQLAAA